MARTKRGFARRRRHNRVLKAAKGYYGAKHRLYKTAHEAVMRAGMSAYRDRRRRKRDFRRLWIARLNAATRAAGLTYSRFMEGVGKAGIALDRKSLADLAVHDAKAFAKIAEQAKAALA